MSSVETLAYSVSAAATAASFALFILAARTALRDSGEDPDRRGQLGIVRNVNGLALAAAVMGLLYAAAGLAVRGFAAGRWPLGSQFEFTLAFSASVLLLYLIVQRMAQAPQAGAIATGLALALLVHAFFIQPEALRAAQPLPPVMRGVWFSLHTLLSALAFGALTVAGGTALGKLLVSSLPVPELVDSAMDIGYVALSLGMICGAIWGEQAWGEYWSWGIKETATLITWWICTFYDHVRHRRGWRGQRVMGVASLALLGVLVTFFGTPALVRWGRLEQPRIY